MSLVAPVVQIELAGAQAETDAFHRAQSVAVSHVDPVNVFGVRLDAAGFEGLLAALLVRRWPA